MATTYEPLCGDSIGHACREATALALRKQCEVSFTFNEVPLIAAPGKTPGDLEAEWQRETDRRAEEYRRSPEYKRSQEQRTREIDRRQNAIDDMMADQTFGDLDSTINWLTYFTEAADDIGVTKDCAAIADALCAAGYINNEHVGQEPAWFNTRERMGRYIVGQAINCLRMNMPPHPTLVAFAEKYWST